MAAKKRKAKRKAKRSPAQRAATAKMLAANRRKKGGRKAAAPKAARRRRRKKAAAAAPAAKRSRRTSRRRKPTSGKRRAWNKGKKFSKTRKRIAGYKRSPNVKGASRWVNPRRRRRSSRRRRGNPGMGGAIQLGVAFLSGGAALVATQHAEPMIPLSGYALGAAEIVAGGVLGFLASMIHPMVGAGVAVGIGGSGVKRIADELMGPPAATPSTPSSLAAIGLSERGLSAIQLKAIEMAAIDMAGVDDTVDAVDLQLGCCDDNPCEGVGEDDDFQTDDYQDDAA